MRSLSLLLTLFICLFHTIIFAQSDSISFYNIQFNHLDAPNELPNDKVWKVFQDSKDFIWIGTHNGLVKWDGVTLKRFMPNHEDSTSILGTSIMDIVEDKEGYLWFLVHNRGLSRFDPKTETFKNFQHQPYLKGLMRLYADNNGIFWLGSYGSGMFRYDTQQDELKLLSIKNFKEGEDLFRNNSIVDITQDITDNNILWCAGNNGLFKFDKTTLTYEHFPSPAPGTALMAGKEIGQNTNDFKGQGVIKNLRSFHIMGSDYGNSFFPNEEIIQPHVCDCDKLRYDVHKAFAYAFYDHPEESLYCSRLVSRKKNQ